MNSKQAYLGILLFSLLISSLFVPLALSADEDQIDDVQVTLKYPEFNSKVTTSFNISFVYLPKITGEGTYRDAALVVNGTVVAYNQTKITDNAENKIYYQVPSNGTYEWNVIVRNNTLDSVEAANAFNLTVEVHVVDPTPTPSPTPTPTHTPTPTATPTVRPTVRPSPTPIPNEITLDTWTIIIIAIFVVVIVGALVLVLLRRKH